jgi:hypothetical protein
MDARFHHISGIIRIMVNLAIVNWSPVFSLGISAKERLSSMGWIQRFMDVKWWTRVTRLVDTIATMLGQDAQIGRSIIRYDGNTGISQEV